MIRATRERRHGWPLAVLAVVGVFGSLRTLRGETAAPPDPVAPRSSLVLSYVANAGVLVSSGGASVLIDALFDEPNPDYRAPTAETLDKMLRGVPPHGGVDLVLVTHDHPDHFDASLVTRYLETFENTRLAAPRDAVEKIRTNASDWARIAPRVFSLDLEVGPGLSTKVPGPVAGTGCTKTSALPRRRLA